jgi:hypothetical protein
MNFFAICPNVLKELDLSFNQVTELTQIEPFEQTETHVQFEQ